jgi:hypothetical protein
MDFSARRLRFGENADSLAAHALLKSTPQLLAGERRAVAAERAAEEPIVLVRAFATSASL